MYEDIVPCYKTADGHNEAEFGMSWCAGFGGEFYNAYFQVFTCFRCISDWSTASNLHLKMNDRRTDNNPPSEVDAYGSDLFHRVTFCWLIK